MVEFLEFLVSLDNYKSAVLLNRQMKMIYTMPNLRLQILSKSSKTSWIKV